MSRSDVVNVLKSDLYGRVLNKSLSDAITEANLQDDERERLSIRAAQLGDWAYDGSGSVTDFIFVVSYNDYTSGLIELARSREFPIDETQPLDEAVLAEAKATSAKAVALVSRLYG